MQIQSVCNMFSHLCVTDEYYLGVHSFIARLCSYLSAAIRLSAKAYRTLLLVIDVEYKKIIQKKMNILLIKITATQNDDAFSYHSVRGLYFLAVAFVAIG